MFGLYHIFGPPFLLPTSGTGPGHGGPAQRPVSRLREGPRGQRWAEGPDSAYASCGPVVALEPLWLSPPLAWCSFFPGARGLRLPGQRPSKGPSPPPSAVRADPQSRRHRVGDGREACAGPHPGTGEWGARPCAVPWRGEGTRAGGTPSAQAEPWSGDRVYTCSAVRR